MVKLIPRPALTGDFPRTIGGVTLYVADEGPVTSIAPFHGKQGAVSAALMAQTGIGVPSPGAHIDKAGVRLVWAGRGRILMIGAPPPNLSGLAAVTDQTGAEAVLVIKGDDAEAVLARLVPMDLRDSNFGPGATARTMLTHMTATVSRMGPHGFELRVMRSMAATLLHDVTQAAQLLAAREP